MSSASALYDFDETMAELENMMGEAQRNLDSSSYRQVLERYLEEFRAPAGVGQPIERAMAAAAPAAEDLREMLVTAERENWADTDKLAQIDAAIRRLRRALLPVAKAVQAARPID
jgi:hypothetical protein